MGDTAFARIEASKKYAFLHNSRQEETMPAHVNRDLVKDNSHYVWSEETGLPEPGLYGRWIEKQVELEGLYRKATGQKIQKRQSVFKECLFLFKDTNTEEEILRTVQGFAREYGVQVIDLHIHRDEGHRDGGGRWIPNLHAHFTFVGLHTRDVVGRRKGREASLYGKSISFTAAQTSHMQTFFAESLGMNRGKSRSRAHLSHIEYKNQEIQKEVLLAQKDLERKKSVDKALGASVRESVARQHGLMEEIKDLQAEIARLRTLSDEAEEAEDRMQEVEQRAKELEVELRGGGLLSGFRNAVELPAAKLALRNQKKKTEREIASAVKSVESQYKDRVDALASENVKLAEKVKALKEQVAGEWSKGRDSMRSEVATLLDTTDQYKWKEVLSSKLEAARASGAGEAAQEYKSRIEGLEGKLATAKEDAEQPLREKIDKLVADYNALSSQMSGKNQKISELQADKKRSVDYIDTYTGYLADMYAAAAGNDPTAIASALATLRQRVELDYKLSKALDKIGFRREDDQQNLGMGYGMGR